MAIKTPGSFTAGRKVTINGTTYQPGSAIPNAVVKGVTHLSSLLSRRIILPDVDPHGRKTRLTSGSPIDAGVLFRRGL